MIKRLKSLPKKRLLAILIFILLAELVTISAGQWKSFHKFLLAELKLPAAHERILILAPHPDDEILGCGGIIQRATKARIPVKIVFFTYGDNNQWSFLVYRKHPVLMPKAVRTMGMIRHQEAVEANATLGVLPENLIFLGYPDFKTLNIWYAYWGPSRPAAMSMLTKVSAVPYPNAFRPGAAYKGEDILADIKKIIDDFQPTKIFVSHPADFNADHKALYLFTRVALWDLEGRVKPSLHPYLIHYKKWPLPRGYHPNKILVPPKIYQKQIDWEGVVLTRSEIEINKTAIQKHRSQYSSTAGYLLTFIRSPHLFGDFPTIAVLPKNGDHFFGSEEDNEDAVSDELNRKEKENFVGIDAQSAYFTDSSLTISICLSKNIGKAAGLSLYVFGYRKDVPFAEMPKIRIRFGSLGYKVLDQNRRIAEKEVSVTREERKMVVQIPLKLLGNPEKILTSANTYLGAIPLDSIPWRVLEIKKDF